MNTGSGCIVRFIWMILGPIALLGAAVAISGQSGLSASFRDALFWVIASAVLAIRYVDLTRLRGRAADGGPAAPSDWRRFAWGFAAGALLVWLLAHVLAFFR